jgi:hypothetical protein
MITFTYKYEEHGWPVAYISDGVTSRQIYPSLITGHGLNELAERVVFLLKMDRQGLSTKERCSWGDEPGEYRWVLENDSGNLNIQILWFDEPWSHLSDDKGKVLFSTQCSLLKFAIQVKTELRELSALSKEDYKKLARSDFPERIYDDLKDLIRTEQLEHKARYKSR